MRARPGEAVATFNRLIAIETDDCVLWPHATNSKGYGQLAVDGVSKSVHVLACEHHHGPRPAHREAAHRCGNRLCVNGRHLRWATAVENAADKRPHGRQRGGRGRPFTRESALVARGLLHLVGRRAECVCSICRRVELDRWLAESPVDAEGSAA